MSTADFKNYAREGKNTYLTNLALIKYYLALRMADSTFSTSVINHISNYPLRQKPPLLKSTPLLPSLLKPT